MSTKSQMELLKSILESSTQYAIVAVDLETTIVAWNAGAQRLYGYESKEAIGKKHSILSESEDVACGSDVLNEVLRSGLWTGTVKRITKAGHSFNAFTTITLLKTSENMSAGYIYITPEMSLLQNVLSQLKTSELSKDLLQIKNEELTKITNEAEEANRLKSEFIANMSHELRTPLNAIIGFTELIYKDHVDPSSPKFKEFLGDIVESAKHLLALINDMLDLAKVEAGKMEFHPVKTNMPNLLGELANVFQTLIIEKNIDFQTEISPELCDVIIDVDKIKQVFYNYISNALKFTQKNGRVRVRVYPDKKDYFRLEIQDSGIGIAANDLHKLFVKFQQIDSTYKKSYSGTGLGLALTKEIVEAQGGHVGVESSLGKGSTFFAVLPCFPYEKKFIDAEPIKMKVENKRVPTILVIESDSQDRALMIDALTEIGYKVVAAPNLSKALLKNHQLRFDAIILDLFQPDMSEWEIIRKLRSKLSIMEAPPIVIKAMLERPISIGFKIHDFLIKPVKEKELLSALEWAGVQPNKDKSVLIIDNDEKALAVAKKILIKSGIEVIYRDNKVSALLALEEESPTAVLLDPLMSTMDGFEFLRHYRQSQKGLITPIIIWTVTKLTSEDCIRLKASIRRVILKGEDLKKSLFAELEQYLPLYEHENKI
jgi:PAS domain S-box-containing protein